MVMATNFPLVEKKPYVYWHLDNFPSMHFPDLSKLKYWYDNTMPKPLFVSSFVWSLSWPTEVSNQGVFILISTPNRYNGSSKCVQSIKNSLFLIIGRFCLNAFSLLLLDGLFLGRGAIGRGSVRADGQGWAVQRWTSGRWWANWGHRWANGGLELIDFVK